MTRRSRLAVMATVLAVAPIATTAFAQASNTDARCIAAINKGTRKIALAENKAIQQCARNWLRGLAVPAESCAAPDASPLVTDTADKAGLKIDASCEGAPPSFGPTDLSAPLLAVDAQLQTLADVFVSTETALPSGEPYAKQACQSTVLSSVQKCANVRLKEFEKCKLKGLRDGTIESALDMNACLFDGTGQPDPKQKISRLCVDKPFFKIEARCTGKNVDLQDAFPGCAGAASSLDVTNCINRSIRCRTCNLLNGVDGTSVDCDVFDDGDDLDNSCPEGAVCGDGIVDGHECDDGNNVSGDGCDGTSCVIEPGWTCSGEPSVCTPICGDGLVRGAETCDDGNTTPGDGCSATCTIEPGYDCTSEPSACTTICGDGLVRGAETCDDGGTAPGDGCNGACEIERGWTCTGEPSSCATVCGDGIIAGAETCDDTSAGGAFVEAGDGCDTACMIEPGWGCNGEPSVCQTICGDGLIRGNEACDDQNTIGHDGCSPSCTVEPGFVCTGEPSDCGVFSVTITSPTHGLFTQASSITVAGHVSQLPPAQAALTINGTPVALSGTGTFSTTVPLSASAIFNPIRATVTDTTNGAKAHARIVVIDGPSVLDGAYSPQSVALRVNDSGLDDIEPLVASLAGNGLDLAQLAPVGTVLVDNQCFIDSFLGCLGRGTVTISTPAPSFSSFGLAMDSMTNFVAGDITVNDIKVNVYLSGSGLVPSCPISISASHAYFNGDYALQPDASDPTNIDVNQLGPLDVSFSNFSTSYGGICDVAVIGDIIQAFMPNVQNLTIGAMQNFLNDPDGSGPLDSPTADAIETALAGVSITGPIGEGLGVHLDAPLFAVTEDNDGVTLGSDSRFTVSIGGGPGQCIPPVGAPNLTRSLSAPTTFPSFGATTPGTSLPYDLGIGISPAGFNQLLRAQVECGLLVGSITELDLGGGPLPLNAGLLTLLIPQMAAFPPSTPFRIDVRPTLAPVVTGDPGPGGALTELRIAQVIADVVANDGSETVALTAAFDANLGMNMSFAPGGLGVSLVPGGTTTVAILYNPLGVDETNLETNVLPPLVDALLPQLAGSLSSFPLPSFFGLQLDGVQVSKNGDFLSLFANLTPAP
jgi:cysteine-rich repeat protein